MTEQFGDKRVVPFSFETDPESVQKEQVAAGLLTLMRIHIR